MRLIPSISPASLGRCLLATGLLLFTLQGAWAQAVRAVPELSGHVIDQTATLQPYELSQLEEKLKALELEKGSQLVILMVDSTLPEDDASYANRVANTWKIGRRAVGDGVLLLVAKNDRKIRIEVAKTLEGAIPDVIAGRIIKEQIAPKFRANDYAGGLRLATDSLAARIRGEALPPVVPDRSSLGQDAASFDWANLIVLALFFVPIVGAIARGIFGRKLGSMLTGGLVAGFIYLATISLVFAVLGGFAALLMTLLSGLGLSGGRRGGRGGPFAGSGGFGTGGGGPFGGSGGFGSGGGGDFGGGGASGSW